MGHPLYQTTQIRRLSQAALERLKTIPRQRLFWKTDEDDPRKHTETHLGLYYQMPEREKMIQIYGKWSPFKSQTTFVQTAWGRVNVMVRQPALSVMQHIRNLEPDQSTKVLLHGTRGRGKEHTLNHVVHSLHLDQDHFIVQVREIKKFTYNPREYNDSTSRAGRVDTPLDAALLLQQIRTVNADLFEKNKDKLVCSQDYRWSIREVTNAGEPLTKIAEHGVNRVNHASDCVAVLLKELMLAANEGKIKLATVIYNLGFLYRFEADPNKLKHADFRKIIVDDFTVARAFKKLVGNKGKNAIVLAACHHGTNWSQDTPPEEILGDEGIGHLDGCTRIYVPKYSRDEYENCMNYYQDIGWLCRPEARTQEFRDELRFISGLNPRVVEYLCLSV